MNDSYNSKNLELQQSVLDEIVGTFDMSEDNRAAFLFALLAVDGKVFKNQQGVRLGISVANRQLAIELFYMLNENGDDAEMRLSTPQDKRKKEASTVIFGNIATQLVFRRIGIKEDYFSGGERFIPDWIAEDDSNKISFLKGIYLTAGRLYLCESDLLDVKEGVNHASDYDDNDSDSRYRKYNRSLQFSFYDVDLAEYCYEALESLDIVSHKLFSHKPYKVIIRKLDSVADFLGYIGAVNTSLIVSDIYAKKNMRRKLQGVANLETHNYDKMLVTSRDMLEIITVLRNKGVLSAQNSEIIEAAELREKYPKASLEELASISKFPVTKSGFSHRMRKLRELYNTIK